MCACLSVCLPSAGMPTRLGNSGEAKKTVSRPRMQEQHRGRELRSVQEPGVAARGGTGGCDVEKLPLHRLSSPLPGTDRVETVSAWSALTIITKSPKKNPPQRTRTYLQPGKKVCIFFPFSFPVTWVTAGAQPALNPLLPVVILERQLFFLTHFTALNPDLCV